MPVKTFPKLARMIGVDQRVAELLGDCDRSLAALTPRSDERLRRRLEDQKRRLTAPDLRLLVSVATVLAEESPALAAPLAAAVKPMLAAHPDLANFHQRLVAASGERRQAGFAAVS